MALTCLLNMAFNMAMEIDAQVLQDAQLIEDLGGPAKVAELLNYDKDSGGVQRVHNWIARGIPPRVKLEYPDIFLRGLGWPDLINAEGATPVPASERT